MTESRFIYYTARTRRACESRLEDAFADAEIVPAERPKIERWQKGKDTGFCITLPATLLT